MTSHCCSVAEVPEWKKEYFAGAEREFYVIRVTDEDLLSCETIAAMSQLAYFRNQITVLAVMGRDGVVHGDPSASIPDSCLALVIACDVRQVSFIGKHLMRSSRSSVSQPNFFRSNTLESTLELDKQISQRTVSRVVSEDDLKSIHLSVNEVPEDIEGHIVVVCPTTECIAHFILPIRQRETTLNYRKGKISKFSCLGEN